MGRYILRRLLVALPTLFVATLIVTGLPRLTDFPDDYSDISCSRSPPERVAPVLTVASTPTIASPTSSSFCWPADLDELRADLGLDKSFPQFYVEWLTGVLRGDFGISAWSGRDVLDSVGARARLSGLLALMALSAATATSVGLGAISAVWPGGWRDRATRALSATGSAVPSFALATMVLYPLSVWFGWVANGSEAHPPQAVLLVLTAVIVGWSTGAMSVRATRTVLLEALDRDHVRTARATGLPERSVIAWHVVPNAVPPLLTIMGRRLPTLLGMLIVVEVVFGLRGVGAFAFGATQVRDYPAIQGVTFLIVLLVVSVTLLIDIARAWLDPRIRYA